MPKASNKKRIIAVDFDGVIHSYESGWQGAAIIPDPPVPGAMQFLVEATTLFAVAIHSSRNHQTGGCSAMYGYILECLLDEFGEKVAVECMDNIFFPHHKPPSIVTIDDRGYRFEGVFPDPEDLVNLHPWNYKVRHPD